MIRRLHTTLRPFTRVHACHTQRIRAKPNGLWYGVETAWIDWCHNERFGVAPLCYQVTLTVPLVRLGEPIPDRGGVLLLDTPEAILEFTRQYRTVPPELRLRLPEDSWHINWHTVSGRYSGIEISPYCWKLRLDNRTNWYYGWDVASGCLWEPVAEVHPVPHPRPDTGKVDEEADEAFA